MKKITRYTFLNLETRPERKLLARCTAERDRIPEELVHFWTGKHFETLDELAKSAIEDGFDNFRCLLHNKNLVVGSIVGQNYNVMRYLKDRITRPDTLEVLLHDDVYFTHPFCMNVHKRLNDYCRTIQIFDRELNIFLLDPTYVFSHDIDRPEPPLLKKHHLILDGIYGSCDYARVYSTKGAQLLLDKMLNDDNPFNPIENYFIQGWDPPGVFTTTISLVKRYSRAGSDTFDHEKK